MSEFIPAEQVKILNERRMRAWEEGKRLLDRASAERRELTAEEQVEYGRIDAELSHLDRQRDAIINNESYQRERELINEEMRRVTAPTMVDDAEKRERVQLASFFGPLTEGRSYAPLTIDLRPAARAHRAARDGLTGSEFRAVVAGDTGASGGSLTVPTMVASSVYSFLTASTAMRRLRTTVITSEGGETLTFPRTATHGIATQVANQDTAFAGTDPVLGQMTLNAFDAGQLIAVANDLIEDTGVDIVGYVSEQVGRAIGEYTAAWYVTGSGSGEPNGVMTAIGGAGTIATGGSLIDPDVDDFIDLEFSIADRYRVNAEWLMRDSTAKIVRKLRDGAGGTVGAYLWNPSPTRGLIDGQPDTFLGYPVFTDPNVASLASNAKVVAFGDWRAYYIRDVRGLRLERSDHLLFNKNQVAFRGLLRTDGDVIDTAALNIIKRSV